MNPIIPIDAKRERVNISDFIVLGENCILLDILVLSSKIFIFIHLAVLHESEIFEHVFKPDN